MSASPYHGYLQYFRGLLVLVHVSLRKFRFRECGVVTPALPVALAEAHLPAFADLVLGRGRRNIAASECSPLFAKMALRPKLCHVTLHTTHTIRQVIEPLT